MKNFLVYFSLIVHSLRLSFYVNGYMLLEVVLSKTVPVQA
jgi:hypothetical protein